HRDDTECVPDAAAPEPSARRLDPERRRKSRQRVRHPDVQGAWGEDENVPGLESPERCLGLHDWITELARDLLDRRRRAVLDEALIDTEADIPVELSRGEHRAPPSVPTAAFPACRVPAARLARRPRARTHRGESSAAAPARRAAPPDGR